MTFLDTTILPAFLIPGRHDPHTVLTFLMSQNHKPAISVLATPILMRAGRKAGIRDTTLRDTLGQFILLPLTPEDYAWALEHETNGDFQGALQVAGALRGGCDTFVTTDRPRAANYAAHISTINVLDS